MLQTGMEMFSDKQGHYLHKHIIVIKIRLNVAFFLVHIISKLFNYSMLSTNHNLYRQLLLFYKKRAVQNKTKVNNLKSLLRIQ